MEEFFPMSYLALNSTNAQYSREFIIRTTSSFSFVHVFFEQYYQEISELLDLSAPYSRHYWYYNFVFFTKDNVPIGFISLNIAKSKKQGKVFIDIWVRPEFRGKGIAFRMYKAIEHRLVGLLRKTSYKCIYATIARDNIASIKLFKKLGFTIVYTNKKQIQLKKCYF